MQLASSSTVPNVSKIMSVFARRSPVKRLDLPLSPVRVYTRDFLGASEETAAEADGAPATSATAAASALLRVRQTTTSSTSGSVEVAAVAEAAEVDAVGPVGSYTPSTGGFGFGIRCFGTLAHPYGQWRHPLPQHLPRSMWALRQKTM